MAMFNLWTDCLNTYIFRSRVKIKLFFKFLIILFYILSTNIKNVILITSFIAYCTQYLKT